MATTTSPAKKQKRNGSATYTAMSARLLELAAETDAPEPYPVTDDITVTPPTRTRRKAMNAAEVQIFFLTELQAKALARTVGAPPKAPAEDAGPEELAEYTETRAEWQRQADAANGSLENIRTQLDAAHRQFDEAFFGEAHEAIVEYFEDKPLLWDKFIPDIRSEFLPPAPHNGVCPTCGHTDEDAAGKASSSST